MTIGMLVESIAGKSSALHGDFHDGTPFKFQEKQRAIELFSEQLCTAGYEYYGSEPAAKQRLLGILPPSQFPAIISSSPMHC